MAVRTLRAFRREGDFDSAERSLISPLEMRSPLNRALYWLVFGILLLLTLTTVFPLFWLFTGALKSPVEFYSQPPTLWPKSPQWGNYKAAWDQLEYTRYFGNTLAIAFGSWLMQMFVTTTAAYSLSKLKPAYGRLILFLFFSTIMVPSAMLLIPLYLTVAKLPIIHVSLLQSWWAIWLPGAVNGFGIFLMKTFFDTVPADLTDAARIDGANAWQNFTRIVLPLSKPALIVLTIGVVMGSWQDFFWPFLVLTGAPEKVPIMVALFTFTGGGNGGGSLDVAIAGSAVAAIPPIILFLIFQKQILRGINLTGLQGQ
jgi:multiple sugar transport system permease protein